MPSLRARLVRRGLITALRLMRARRPPIPDGDSPADDVLRYVLAVREQIDRAGSRMRVPRSTRSGPLRDAPVGGLLVADELVLRGRSGPGGRRQRGDGDIEVAATDRVLLHLHGGAYSLGSPQADRSLAAGLSQTAEAVVVVPDYRLAPEAVFPAGLDDAYATYRWLVDDRGIPPPQIGLSGVSAGGGLGAAMLVRLRDEGTALPACFVALSPWTDLAGTGASIVELAERDPWLPAELVERAGLIYAGATPVDDPFVSPLYADLTGLPPMLVHVGGDEILLDDAVRFVARARAHGVDASLGRFDGLWHVFAMFPGVPEAAHARREIGAFVRRHTVAP